ncbi:aminomethyltransferase family protein [Pseudoprimorskyibacter insulae]|uniref:Aminomethyltransferase n=1 Tax=Pseudoprimorskyibacter insulae TaxID=1695997 RepID=A0A2R8AWG9_9RHOB|nr:aminomethyltransferase family protein [Pseudoprimorskyibacter insulae]SPF80214.1 Aminomethyltransferase [Pseudoprimorskyibacter insulae]
MTRSLEDKLKDYDSPAQMLQNAQIGKYVYPIPAEFSNWVDEQLAWRNTAVLFDQSVHMTDLYVKGPDTIRLLSDLAVNSFKGFGRNKAKQIVCCNEDGYLIGDSILFGLEDDEVNIVGRPNIPNWVQYHAETGGYDVEVFRDERRLDAPDAPRRTYRYEVQGPNAMAILEAVNEGGPLVTKFFNMGEITIAGCKARTLSHGMGGQKGLELWGPYEDGPKVKAALVEAGKAYGMRQAGARAYATVAMESGWIPSPLPAIYTGASTKGFREWLTDRSFEAVASIGGSYQSGDVTDYYLTPWDLDYHRVIKFDHDFIGRAALEKMTEAGGHRTKVTLVWDKESILEIFGGLMDVDGLPPKLMEMPAGHYAAHPYDAVTLNGAGVGISTYPVYTANERAWISLAVVNGDLAAPGTKVNVLWGEADGGTGKPVVERHRQMTVGATVQPWPIHTASRMEYRKQD